MNASLPTQYRFSHEYSVLLNQQLEHLINYGVQNKVYSIHIELSDKKQSEEFSALNSTEIFDWLNNNGYRSHLEKMILMSLYPALISDMFLFIDEALNCLEKGRLTTAYSLFRKPLRDNLFYLEWLLVEPTNFAGMFYDKEPTEFVLDRMLREEKVLPIITKAVDRVGKTGIVIPEVIYEMRYKSKTGFYSLNAMWNQALHLITTSKSHNTPKREFNLIFSDDEDKFTQWEHIYSSIPVILHYGIEIAEALMFLVVGDRPSEFRINHFHRELGFSVWSRDLVLRQNDPQLLKDFPNDLDDLYVKCPSCKKKIDVHQEQARALFLDRKIKCQYCNRGVSIESIVVNNPI